MQINGYKWVHGGTMTFEAQKFTGKDSQQPQMSKSIYFYEIF